MGNNVSNPLERIELKWHWTPVLSCDDWTSFIAKFALSDGIDDNVALLARKHMLMQRNIAHAFCIKQTLLYVLVLVIQTWVKCKSFPVEATDNALCYSLWSYCLRFTAWVQHLKAKSYLAHHKWHQCYRRCTWPYFAPNPMFPVSRLKSDFEYVSSLGMLLPVPGPT